MKLNDTKNNFKKEIVSEDISIIKNNESTNFNQKKNNLENEDSSFNKENKENKDINIVNVIGNKKRENNTYDSIILKRNIKYGIDETGNPMDVNQYYKNINNKTINKKRLVAYIIKDENNENVLVDLNGNKIIKNKEGDYEFPFQLKLLIKDFDVKHPELRLIGERIYSTEDSLKMNLSQVPHQSPNIFKNRPIDNDKIKMNNLVKSDSKISSLGNKEHLLEEISLQIDSIETSDNTSLRITNNNNNIVNYIYKNNLRNKNDENDIYKLRYGKSRDKANKSKERNKNSYEKNLINYSHNRSKNSIFNNKEIILRTNSILNINKSNDNIFSNRNNNINIFNNLTQSFNQSKNIENKISNNKNYYYPLNKKNHSPIKNKNRTTYNKNHILNNRNIINNSILNSEASIANNINNSQNNI